MTVACNKRGLRGSTLVSVLLATFMFAGLLGGRHVRAATPSVLASGSTKHGYLTPVELKFSRDDRMIYVVCEDDDSVIAVDERTRRVVARAKVGHKPKDVAVALDGRTLYVSNEWSDTVSEIEAKSFLVRRTFRTGWGPIGLTTDQAGKFLYVANSIGDDISVIDILHGVEIKRLAAWRSPHYVLLSRDGRRVYVSNLLPHLGPPDQPPVSELTAIDTQTNVVAERILVPEVVELRHIAEAPPDRGSYLLVPFMRPKNLNPLVQISQGWIMTHGVAMIPSHSGVNKLEVTEVLLDDADHYYAGTNGIAFSPDGRQVLVTSSEADTVSVIDTSMLEGFLRLRRTVELPNQLDSAREFVTRRLSTASNPTAVVVSLDGRTAYIANRLDDSLTVIDMSTQEVKARIGLGGPGELTPLRRGQQLFHDASVCFQGQFACASCHPDDHIDGLAWNLETPQLGHDRVLNRTLRGIAETAPYKWNGHNPDLETQCGPRAARFLFHSQGFSSTQLADLVTYIKSIPLPPNRHLAPNGRLTPAQKRGRQVFFGRHCDTCHTPETHYTAKTTVDVGTADKLDTVGVFDIPQLERVYEHPPYLHSGKALSLEEIWTKFNTGDKHGISSDMSKEELNDLVEYLKTL